MSSMRKIFYDCQFSATSHARLIKQLIKIYLKSDLDEFVSEFTSLLKRSLIHGDKQPSVERTLNFVAKFATTKKEESRPSQSETEPEKDEDSDDEADLFLVHLIKFLLNNHEASCQGVRFRVCQLINKLLNQMGEEAVIDDDLYSIIYDTLLHRLQDRIPGVRVQAVLALARLQDPRSKDCPVIKAYRYHLAMDPNPDVRRAVLSSTAITFQTLPDILDRTRDVRDTVRREAFKALSHKVHIRSLTIAQRVRLVSEGLKDRSDMVRSVVEKNLLPHWLRILNGNVLDLLECLDVEASVDEAELALKTIFRGVPYPDLINNFGLLKEERIVNPSELRPESALYWRFLAQHLIDEGAEDALDTVIPELTKFCAYVQDYSMTEVTDTGDPQETAVQCMEREFVTSQLISMTMLYDLSDEVGRRSLDKLVRTLLVSDKITDSLVKVLVEVFGRLHPPTTRVNQLAEIISEVREPTTTRAVVVQPISDEEQRKKKIQAARIRVRMNQAHEEMEECVRSLDFSKAQILKEELDELETELSLINMERSAPEEVQTQEELNDPTTLRKCLMIVCRMVENPDVADMTPTLYSLHENLVLPCLRCEDPAVRNQAVKALGLFCLLSLDLASQHLVLFLQISRIDVEQIQLSALHCLIDILHLYGLEEFTEAAEDISEVNDTSMSSVNKNKENKESEEAEEDGGVIISALCQMMESECVEVRTHAAEGLCKLLLASRITSSKLLSHLILMWYNPATEDDSLLRHMLGVFFPLYASYGGTNQESLCAAVLPSLQTLFNAPLRSPLADVDVDDVANFLISITSPSFATGESIEQVNTHDTLVFTICTDILANPDSGHVRVLIRCLNHLNLTPTNYSTLRQVKVLADKMITKVRERTCHNGLDRFITTIQKLLKNAPEPVPEEEEAGEKAADKSADESAVATPLPLSETTMIRKKRMLYNQTHSDLEMFSSEAESDGESTPSIDKARRVFQEVNSDDISDIGSPIARSTQIKETDTGASAENRVVCRPVGDSELEVSPKVQEDDVAKMKGSKKRSKKERSSTSEQSGEEEVKTPPKVPRTARTATEEKEASPAKTSNRRRTKKQTANTEESSEGEAAVPSKVPKTTSLVKKGRFPVIRLKRLSDSVFGDVNTESEVSSNITVSSSKKSSESSPTSEKDTSCEGDVLPRAKTSQKKASSLQDTSSQSDEEKDTETGSSKRMSSRSSASSKLTVDVTPRNRRKIPQSEESSSQKSEVAETGSSQRKSTRSSVSSSMTEIPSSQSSVPAERTPRNRRKAPEPEDISSQRGGEKTEETGSSQRKSTRSPVSSSLMEVASSRSSLSVEPTPQTRKGRPRKAATSLDVTPRSSGRRGRPSVESSQTSQTTLSSSQRATASEDVTPVRRSRRTVTSSQSTESDSEETPGRLRTQRSSARKAPQKEVASTRKSGKKK